MLKKLYKKLFKLPSPIELGWSKSNALGMRSLKSSNQDKTWEDYEEYCKKNHKIKSFLQYTVYDNISGWYYSSSRYISHLKDKYIRKPHLLNLSGNLLEHNYKYKTGYLDPDSQLLLSFITIVNNYVKELSESRYHYSLDSVPLEYDPESDGDKECWEEKQKHYKTIKEAYYFFNVERPRILQEIEDSYKPGLEKEDRLENSYKIYNKEKDLYELENKHMKAVIEVRKGMWL
jgi:hypothetical protein